MKATGFLLIAVGVAIAIAAMCMSTSLPTALPAGLYGGSSSSEVYNLGLLQRQMMIFVAGLAVVIVGAGIASAGAVIEHLARHGPVAVAPLESVTLEPAADDAIVPARSEAEQAEWNRDADRFTYRILGGLGVIMVIIIAITLASLK